MSATEPHSLDRAQLHLVDSVDEAAELLRWLSTVDRVAVDTETTGLSPEHDKVRLAQLGDGVHGWAIPWDQWGGVFVEALSRFEGHIVCHNLKFDAAMLAAAGLVLPQDRCDDTYLMAHVLEPDKLHSLKVLGSRYVDRRAATLQQELDEAIGKKGGWRWDTVPIGYQPYWAYAGLDAVLTFLLAEQLEPKLEEAGARRAYDLELACSWVLNQMERTGIMVDRPYTVDRYAKFRQREDELAESCEAKWECRPTQNAKVAEVLLAEGMQLDKVTASGAVQMDKEVLTDVDHPLADLVLDYRRLHKLSGTYLKNFLELTSEADPRLHGQINPVGARTGRTSMAKPNLQNLPRKADASAEAIEVRNCIIAGEDRRLLMIDFDQIEARIFTHLSRDPGLVQAFYADDDFFTVTAREVFNDPTLVKADERRQRMKNGVYALTYGAGAPRFVETVGLPDEEGYAMYNRLHALYPGIGELKAQIEQVAINRRLTEGVAYVRSPLTGRRHPADKDKLYTLVDYLIQGTATEIFKQKLLELDAAGLGELMVLPVHDEVIFDVPIDDFEDVTRTALEVLNDDQLLSVPITAGASHGHRWGEKREC